MTNGRCTLRWGGTRKAGRARGRRPQPDDTESRGVGEPRRCGRSLSPSIRRVSSARVWRAPSDPSWARDGVVEQHWVFSGDRERADVRLRFVLDVGASFLRVGVLGDNVARDLGCGLCSTPSRPRQHGRGRGVRARRARANQGLGRRLSPRDARPTAPLHRYGVALQRETRSRRCTRMCLTEYEPLKDGFAVTLVRSVGELSRSDLRERPGTRLARADADAQCIGPPQGWASLPALVRRPPVRRHVGCELLAPPTCSSWGQCLTPYPSDFFNVDDPPPAGKRHAYPRRALPANTDGVAIDPAPWNTLDGFSRARPTVYFPQGVDLTASGVARIDSPRHVARRRIADAHRRADAPGCRSRPALRRERRPPRSEGVPVAPPAQAFLLRPAVRLKNATLYIVALRKLIGGDGLRVNRPDGFAGVAPAGFPGQPAALEARRPHMQTIFAKLADCGVAGEDLVLAWDFTTASDDALERWLLHMRDETFAALGTGAPSFAVTSVEDDPFGDPRICRRVRGVYTVPLYTTANAPGTRLNVDPATNLPVQTASRPTSLHRRHPVQSRHARAAAAVRFLRPRAPRHGRGEVSNAPDLRALADRRLRARGHRLAGHGERRPGADPALPRRPVGFPILPERLPKAS